jgi:hypothetical protein
MSSLMPQCAAASLCDRTMIFGYDNALVTMYIFRQERPVPLIDLTTSTPFVSTASWYTIDVMLNCSGIRTRLIFKNISASYRREGHTDDEICHYLAGGKWAKPVNLTPGQQWRCIHTTGVSMYYGRADDEMYVSYPAELIGIIMDKFEDAVQPAAMTIKWKWSTAD